MREQDKTPFWKFWKPESEFIGGMIMGLIVIVLALFLIPLLLRGYELWAKYLGIKP